jgi:hypothetical protein
VVVLAGHHNSSHDGRNVEVRPFKHLSHHGIDCEILTSVMDPLLHWNSPLVVNGFRLVTIIVGLDQEPSLIRQLIESMSSHWVTFDDHPLISLQPCNDEIDRRRDIFSSQSFVRCRISTFLLKDLSQQPAGGDMIVLDDTDQGVLKVFVVSCIDIDRKSSSSNSG